MAQPNLSVLSVTGKTGDKIILSEAPTGVENVQIILEAIDKSRARQPPSWYLHISFFALSFPVSSPPRFFPFHPRFFPFHWHCCSI